MVTSRSSRIAAEKSRPGLLLPAIPFSASSDPHLQSLPPIQRKSYFHYRHRLFEFDIMHSLDKLCKEAHTQVFFYLFIMFNAVILRLIVLAR